MAPKGRMESSPVGEPDWLPQYALEADLRRRPRSFGFFQAVRLLQRLMPGRAGVGRFVDPDDEVVRFDVAPFIAFPASEIDDLELPDSGPARMTVNFMGLTGPLGVLPFDYTQLVAQRAAVRDRALKDFLDIFHHRIVSLFYRAWEKNRLAASRERGATDLISAHLADLIGVGLGSQKNRLSVPDDALLFYAGLLAPQQRSAVGLQQLLEDYFDVPVEIEQFVGGWYPLAADSQTHVGDTEPSTRLGEGAVAGDEIWDQQARIRIRVGPLTREQYEEFLPAGTAHDALRDLLRFYCNDQFDFEIQLVLAKDEVPACVIGVEDELAQPLGLSTWIRTAPFERDADEAVLSI
jgi:type VI secretion system protein ImpH